jgi:hypothetical protein
MSDRGGLLFEGGGEGFPLGEQGGALVAEGFELGGGALGVLGGGVVAEVLLGCGDASVERGEFLIDGEDAVFELLELDRVEALDGGGRRCSLFVVYANRRSFGSGCASAQDDTVGGVGARSDA